MALRARHMPRRLRSQWRPGYWLRHPMLSLVVCVVLAALLVLMAFASAYDTSRLNEHGLRASATVVEVHDVGRDSYVTVRFTTAAGRDVTASVYDFYWRPRPRTGDVVTVVYDPQSPDTILRDARMNGDYVLPLLSLALAGGVGIGGPIWLRRTWSMWRDNAEAWRAGRHFA